MTITISQLLLQNLQSQSTEGRGNASNLRNRRGWRFDDPRYAFTTLNAFLPLEMSPSLGAL